MIEYIFFEASLRDKFVAYAEQRGVPCTTSDDHMGMVVAIPEDLPEQLADELEDYHEALEDEQEELSLAEGELRRLAGFGFKLPDGQARMLPLDTDMANRLLANFTLEEIQELLNSVARYALEPPNEHLCKILAEQAAKDRP
ncbi:MAG: hypothetical protein A2Z95_06810 [Gallionellales bacterium GWA2_60_18]|nr:MAG: hypothetical protein A2Z95_06810 [Gallionellales bacterium GWA2_60_18]